MSDKAVGLWRSSIGAIKKLERADRVRNSQLAYGVVTKQILQNCVIDVLVCCLKSLCIHWTRN